MKQAKEAKEKEQQQKNVFLPGGFWMILLGALCLGVGVAYLSLFFDKRPEKFTFIAQGVLNVLIIVAVMVQALIYRRQWDAMEAELSETRKMVGQNERAVTAAEDGVTLARQSFQASERPHFGIANVTMHFEIGHAFSLSMTFVNGGRSPAWHFRPMPRISLNEWFPEFSQPNDEGPWAVMQAFGDLHNSFVPAGDKKPINFSETEFVVTKERYDAVYSENMRLFVKGRAEWVDSSGDDQYWDFSVLYYSSTKRFGEYEC